jgi:hypothetical protein
MNRKLILGALIGATAIVSLPSAANAATCTYDGATKRMDVRYRSGESSVTIKPGNTLQFSDGGLLRTCFDPATGKAATGANTVRLTVKAVSGTGPQTQKTILDETSASLIDQNRALDMFVLTGTNDRFVLKKGARNDSVRLSDSLGPEIDLDYNLENDVHMTTSNTSVEVDGGAGNDLIDASLVRFYNTDQIGEAGNDVLVGGAKKDGLFGSFNDDVLFSDGDPGQIDIVQGGDGTDRGKVDFGFDQFSQIELFNL